MAFIAFESVGDIVAGMDVFWAHVFVSFLSRLDVWARYRPRIFSVIPED